MKKLKTAVIGCGRVSKFHAESYKTLPESELIAGVDTDKLKRDEFSNKYNVKTYASTQELLDSENVDLISICTPHFTHFEIAKQIISKNINVLIEKPVCLKQNHFDELLELEKNSHSVISVCFQNRFNDTVKTLDKAFTEDKLGKILIGNVCVRWFRSQEYYDDAWHGNLEKSGGGALITQAIHHIDLLKKYMGVPVEITGFSNNLRARAEVEDSMVAALKFSNGSLASFECSTVTYPKHIEASLTLIGEKGTIKIGGTTLNVIEYSSVEGISKDDTIDDAIHLYGTGHIKLIGDVIDSIINKHKPAVTLADGIETMKLINAIYKDIQRI